MSQEISYIDSVICPEISCKKIFLRRELVSFGNILVIPEHYNANTDGLCSGSFEAPMEVSNVQFLSPVKLRQKTKM